MGYKEDVVTATQKFTEWSMKNEISEAVDWAEFREILNGLNPEMHTCVDPDCTITEWKGTSDVCPVCGATGDSTGRRAK